MKKQNQMWILAILFLGAIFYVGGAFGKQPLAASPPGLTQGVPGAGQATITPPTPVVDNTLQGTGSSTTVYLQAVEDTPNSATGTYTGISGTAYLVDAQNTVAPIQTVALSASGQVSTTAPFNTNVYAVLSNSSYYVTQSATVNTGKQSNIKLPISAPLIPTISVRFVNETYGVGTTGYTGVSTSQSNGNLQMQISVGTRQTLRGPAVNVCYQTSNYSEFIPIGAPSTGTPSHITCSSTSKSYSLGNDIKESSGWVSFPFRITPASGVNPASNVVVTVFDQYATYLLNYVVKTGSEDATGTDIGATDTAATIVVS